MHDDKQRCTRGDDKTARLSNSRNTFSASLPSAVPNLVTPFASLICATRHTYQLVDSNRDASWSYDSYTHQLLQERRQQGHAGSKVTLASGSRTIEAAQRGFEATVLAEASDG